MRMVTRTVHLRARRMRSSAYCPPCSVTDLRVGVASEVAEPRLRYHLALPAGRLKRPRAEVGIEDFSLLFHSSLFVYEPYLDVVLVYLYFYISSQLLHG